MGPRGTEVDEQLSIDSTPEDVASLYAWANLRGAKYRDYSASRREHRAQVRYRAAKNRLERELTAHADAEAAAVQAEHQAFAAEAVALSQDGPNFAASRLASLRSAEAAAGKAVAERLEAALRAEAAAHAAILALREEREIAEARSSAQEKATVYAEAGLRRRELAGPQPHSLPGEFASGVPGMIELDSGLPVQREAPGQRVERPQQPAEAGEDAAQQSGPAWLFAAQVEHRAPGPPAIDPVSVTDVAGGDTLQDSRERVAAHWFALKGAFEQAGPELPEFQQSRPGAMRGSLLAVFSLAGGVGKTSLVATLGRSFAAQGERVLLTDTASHGLLPFYFGAQCRPGELGAWPPPAQRAGKPISLVVYDAAFGAGEEEPQALAAAILRNCKSHDRLLMDLAPGASWLLGQMMDLHPAVLVPISPDMNSVLSLQAVETTFRRFTDSEGHPVLPFYVINQFDATRPLHLDVREVFRRKLGDRLLRVAIRHSPAVSEALAEGMTVIDYAPSDPASQDYLEVAAWLKEISPPAATEFRGLHRGEW